MDRQTGRLSRRALFRVVAVSGGVAVLSSLTGCSLFGGGGYGNGDSSGDRESSETTTVEMKDIAFLPPSITVPPGSTVTWINRDAVDHTITGEGHFDSARIAPGERFEFTFEVEGTYEYVCTIHPDMTGEVVVEAEA